MVCVKHTTHPIGNKALLEITNMASEEVTEALLTHMQDSVDVASSSSHDGSSANTSDSDSESRSSDSVDELTASELDLSKWAKVTTTTAATVMTFDFSMHPGDEAACSLFPKGLRSSAQLRDCCHTLSL
jgi:hypothetical protein